MNPIIKLMHDHPAAVFPTRATVGSAAYDFYAAEVEFHEEQPWIRINTGVRMALPDNHALLLFSRSGLANAYGLQLRNGVGVVDPDYRGTIQFIMQYREGFKDNLIDVIKPGARVAQGIILPIPQFSWMAVPNLDDTERGEGGFGSSGI